MNRSRSTFSLSLGRPVAAALIALAVAACGTSAPGATTAGNQGQPTPGAPGATVAGQPTGASIATSPPANGGGLTEADDFCLISTEDVAAQLGVEVATATGTASPGIGGACSYSDSAGTIVLTNSVLIGAQAGPTFDAYASTADAEEVSGVGDRAIYLPVMGELLGIAFIKGDVVVSMAPAAGLPINDDEAALDAALLELGRLAAERL